MALSERIQKIRDFSCNIGCNPPENTYYFDLHHAARTKYAHLDRLDKIANCVADAFENQKIYIEDFDRLIGRVFFFNDKPIANPDPDFDHITLAKERILAEIEDYSDFMQLPQVVGDNHFHGHICWNWNTMLRLGTSGLKAQCELEIQRTQDEKRLQYYRNVITVLCALERWNDKHVDELKKRGMTELAAICEKVPKYPAETFHEAVQAFYMQYIAIMRENPGGGNSPGRLDYFLWPYLERDLKENRCTMEEARELIDELFIRINERIWPHDGWVETVVVGGTHANGGSAVNPLSYMMVESIMDLDIIHPAVYARIPEHAPEEWISFCAKYVTNGKNRAQLLSDKNIITALIKNGVSYQDAVDYYCGGCMEIGIQGKTNDYLFNAWHNMPKMVELAITGGKSLSDDVVISSYRSKGLEHYETFDSFYADFIKEVKRIIYMFFRAQDFYSEEAEKKRPAYLISSMLDDCITKGKTMHAGGTRYYDYGSTPIGLPAAADSLFAIKKAVFEEKICTAEELLCALRANFAGYETLQKKLLKLPKYGQGNPEADAMAHKYFRDVSDIYTTYENRFGGRGKIVIFTFLWSAEAGAGLGATASGKNAGVPVAHGVTPHSSAMTKGLTTAINSCTAIDFTGFNGGASTMWDLDPRIADEPTAKALFTAFFQQGGQIFQGNTTDVEELIQAQKNPENYPNLMVRVGGFSARFIYLSEPVQNEIIHRLRHTI